MKLILLHGLGQTPDNWSQVQEKLALLELAVPPLFSDVSETEFVDLNYFNTKVSSYLTQLKEPFVLGGLSLGAVLTLHYLTQENPYLKGIIVAAPQFESPNRWLYGIQNFVFRILPPPLFKKAGIPLTKKQTLTLLESMNTLQLKEIVAASSLPTLILCGTKDKANLSAAKKLANLMPKASFQEIPGGNHALNETDPTAFADKVIAFMKQFSLINNS